MRISKANHLQRLLQTQDVLLGTLVYAGTVDLLSLAGLMPPASALAHLQFTPLVLLCCLLSSVTQAPRLHGLRMLDIVVFSVRYSLFALGGLLFITYFAQLDEMDPRALVAFALLLAASLFTNRSILRWWYFKTRMEHPSNYLKVLVIGAGPRAQALMRRYREQSEWGVDIIGILDPDPVLAGTTVEGAPVLGNSKAIRNLLAEQVVDEVIICLPRSLVEGVNEIVGACEEEGVCVKFLADIYDIPRGNVVLEMVGSQPVLSFEPVSREEWKLVVKRIFDLLITLPALFLMLPVFGLVALAIRLDSPGPVFFRQPRVGLNKRTFDIIKFRSMYQDAEARLAEIEHLNEADGPIFKIACDPRVTRVGRWIRRTSIDELPQLINVLLGQMSLVGPRPMSVRDVNQFSLGIQRRRFSVKPGLACLREISGRSQLTFERWLELDLHYIEHWSLWLDVKILLKLLPAVLKGDGAT